jgi:transcriptional regulator GlxA family with amidase domain
MKEIAATTGFSSYASFWRSYVNKFGRAPSKARPIAPDDDDIPPPHEP